MFLKVSLTKGVMRFRKKNKLDSRFIGPFEILKQVCDFAYELTLTLNLSHLHRVFHVSMLQNYIYNPSHILEHKPLQVHEDLSYEEQPVMLLNCKEQVIQNKVVPNVKVLWHSHSEQEATWEGKNEMKIKYLHLFHNQGTCLNSKIEFL